jgi:uncharacterized protein DUF3574
MLALSLLAGCSRAMPSSSSPPLTAPSCASGDSAGVRETLYFGRNRPSGGTVSDTEWGSFLAEVVTPKFPEGLTVLEGTGQWKAASGAVEQERSEIVTIFHSDTEGARRSVQEIAREYKRRFQQEAVLRERAQTCVGFE